MGDPASQGPRSVSADWGRVPWGSVQYTECVLILGVITGTTSKGLDMRDAVIVEAVRTPTGKRNGGLSGVHPAELSAHVLRALAERSGVDPALVDDVIWGCVSQIGEQTMDIGRTAPLAAGWPETVTGVTLDRQCGSSQQSVHFAAAGLIAGQYDVVVAGGVESMSRVPMGSTTIGENPYPQAFLDRYDGVVPNQGVGAEMIAERWGFSRQQLDEYSVGSHEKAAAARDEGRFDAQIAPVTTDAGVVARDEGIRESTVEKLGTLKPAFKEDGVITAGNASQISDGSAALLMTTSEKARELGLTPIVRVHTAVLAGADPVIMLTAPIPATQKALAKSGLRIDEIGAFEVNEAFAPVPLAWLADLHADAKALNANGGAIALGHPLGGSGARLMTTLVHHMRDNGIRYGLQTMCEGGGQANATILELL
jgi:acetyl-CoA acyltransferase